MMKIPKNRFKALVSEKEMINLKWRRRSANVMKYVACSEKRMNGTVVGSKRVLARARTSETRIEISQRRLP
jgi:hypothetical protein